MLLRRTGRIRLVAAIASVGITTLVLLARTGGGWQAPRNASKANVVGVLILIPARRDAGTPAPAREARKRSRLDPAYVKATKPGRPLSAAALAAALDLAPAPAAVPLHDDVPEPPSAPTSAPLRIDSSVLRAASKASRSPLATLIDDPHQRGDTTAAPHAGTLGAAITKAAKPDCLRPGESLLSALTAAAQRLADKCN